MNCVFLLEPASSVIHAVSGTMRLQDQESRMAVGDHKRVRLAHERTRLRRDRDRAGPIGIDGIGPEESSAADR